MLFSKDLAHHHAVRHALLRGAMVTYLAFGVISFLLARRYGGWLPPFFGLLFLGGAGIFWQCSQWLAQGRHGLLAVRLSTACLLFVTTAYALSGSPQLPAPGAMIYVLVLLFSCLTDTRRGAWVVCACCIALYVGSLWLRLRWFNIPTEDPTLLLTLYLFTPMLFGFFTFIATDLNVYLRTTFRTSVNLRKDLDDRTLEFQTLLQTMNEGFVVIDEANVFRFVNDKFCEMVGLPREAILGRSYFEFSAVDEANMAILHQQRTLRTQQQRSSYELQVNRPDGRRMTLLISAIPNIGPAGEYRGASCVISDITARKEAEEALKAERALLSQRVAERTASLQSAYAALARELGERRQAEAALRAAEEEYRLLFDRVPLGIYRSSLDGRQLRANPTLVKLNGYETEAEMLAAVHDIASEWYVDPNRRAEFRRLLAEHGQVANFESEIYRHKTRERIWISESAVLVVDSAGQPLYYQGTVEEITTRKQVELQQERLIQELARVAQMKDEFLASVSHELRTPLNAILNLTELLRDRIYGPLTGRQARALATIDESGRHLLSLINDLLDLARFGAGQDELNLRPVRVTELCQASMKFVRTAADKKKLRLYFTPDAAVQTILADELRLKQILINLLSNAVKFTPERGAIGLEVLGQATPEPSIQLVVWDTGIGIPPEALDQIFHPFVQIDSRLARQHEGTGLGLALVRQMVELHNGTITVESQVERGSRFTVTLPWIIPATTEPPSLLEQPSDPLARPESANRTPQLLVVSGENGASQVIADYLRFKQYDVSVVHEFEQAQDYLHRQGPPAAVIVDLPPPLDSDQPPLTLFQRPDALRRPPLIVLTSRSANDLPSTTGAEVIYLTKPVSLQQLVAVLEDQLASG
jgi:PAS domain S-box-containing protein